MSETIREKIQRQMREEESKREEKKLELEKKMEEAADKTVEKYGKLVEKGLKKIKQREDLLARVPAIDEDIAKVEEQTKKYEQELMEIGKGDEIINWLGVDEADQFSGE